MPQAPVPCVMGLTAWALDIMRMRLVPAGCLMELTTKTGHSGNAASSCTLCDGLPGLWSFYKPLAPAACVMVLARC